MIDFLPFHLRDLPLFNKIAIIPINFIALALLVVVFNHNKFRDRRSQLFLLMTVFMLTWVDFAYLARIFGQYSNLSEVFLRVAWIATPLLFFCTYYISLYLVELEEKYRKYSWFLLVLTIILSSLTAFTDVFIAGVKFTDTTFLGINTLIIVYGKFFLLFLVGIFVLIVSTLFPLMKSKMDNAAKMFLLGLMIFYLANIIFNIALPVFLNTAHFYYFGDYSTIFLLGFTTYAVLRHRLFDVRVFSTELLTIVIWSILFSKLFVSQDLTEFSSDFLVFVLTIVFGVLLIRSITKEVEQKDKLQELTQKLQALDKQKDEFISMAAHELRSPLTAIKGYISMILEGDTGEIPGKAKEFLVDTTSVTERLIRLVNNMLNVSRIEEGRLVYQMEEVDLIKALQEIYYSFRFEAERKGLKFNFDVPHGIYDKVYVDPDKIREIVGNLVSNAIKFTEKGSITMHVSQPDASLVRVSIADTGPGISKEEQEKLFQKFYRAESTSGKTIGTGLGLYITKLLLEKFNGRIGLDSEVNAGSTFWFEIPVYKGEKH